MSGIKKVVVKGTPVIIVDFTGLDQDGMIAQFTQLKDIVLADGGRQLVVTIYSPKNFGTPQYMKHVRTEGKLMIDNIDKIASVGLSRTQKMLLKGLSFFFRRNFKAFDTLDEALEYLLDHHATDHDVPEYLKDL